ncbi:hypothetical protein SNE26_09925 [Mucilaginibacter sp. cycad4]|uniref:hypothetical protein n=1 Tax=Mucilaginibacter sp. cycad4 TaxID=3342096 RepID=UPI002AAB2BC3|nr:hypothetical protein [Mucilaginibacter gossypii]WPV02093.1 hypothetical protein SNE26_09925 [Mucilaginibacter gossypii]
MFELATIKLKWKYILAIIAINLLAVSVSFADPGDGLCDGNDGGPDGCPLDTWVWGLILVAMLFTVRHLGRKNKIKQSI